MLPISEFKKLYEEIKSFSNNLDEMKIDSLKINFLDYYCNRFKDSYAIFSRFDWNAVYQVK